MTFTYTLAALLLAVSAPFAWIIAGVYLGYLGYYGVPVVFCAAFLWCLWKIPFPVILYTLALSALCLAGALWWLNINFVIWR